MRSRDTGGDYLLNHSPLFAYVSSATPWRRSLTLTSPTAGILQTRLSAVSLILLMSSIPKGSGFFSVSTSNPTCQILTLLKYSQEA